MRFLMFFLLVALSSIASVATAGQSGEGVCLQSQMVALGDSVRSVCDLLEIRVHVTSDGDAGLPGAFGVGLELDDGRRAYWTAATGFVPFTRGMMESADGYYEALPAVRDYVIFKGNPAEICAQTGGVAYKVFAGHGALSPAQEQMIQSALGTKTPSAGLVTVDHMRATFIHDDSLKNSKNGVVYTDSCLN